MRSFPDERSNSCEFLRDGVERDCNWELLVLLVEYKQSRDCCAEGSDTLLTINKHLLVHSSLAALQVSADRLPRDQVADRVSIVQGVHEVSNLHRAPYKRPL